MHQLDAIQGNLERMSGINVERHIFLWLLIPFQMCLFKGRAITFTFLHLIFVCRQYSNGLKPSLRMYTMKGLPHIMVPQPPSSPLMCHPCSQVHVAPSRNSLGIYRQVQIWILVLGKLKLMVFKICPRNLVRISSHIQSSHTKSSWHFIVNGITKDSGLTGGRGLPITGMLTRVIVLSNPDSWMHNFPFYLQK